MGNKRIEKKKAKMKEIRAMKKTLRETDIPKAHLEILSNSGKGSAEVIHRSEKNQKDILLCDHMEENSAIESSKKKVGTKSLKPAIYLQFEGMQVERNELFNAVKQWWKDQGYLIKDLKDMNLYAKPEEKMMYFTINDTIQGSISIPFVKL